MDRIMAKDNNKNRNPAAQKQGSGEMVDKAATEKSRDIDVSSAKLGEKESDSELDIQALLRKYMPDYDKDEGEEAEESEILSGLRIPVEDTAADTDALAAMNWDDGAEDGADIAESLHAIRWHREAEPGDAEPPQMTAEEEPEDMFASLMKKSSDVVVGDGAAAMADASLANDFDFTDDIPADPGDEGELEDEEGIYEEDVPRHSRSPKRAKEEKPKKGLFSLGKREKKEKHRNRNMADGESDVLMEPLPEDLFAEKEELGTDAIVDSMGLEEELLSPMAKNQMADAMMDTEPEEEKMLSFAAPEKPARKKGKKHVAVSSVQEEETGSSFGNSAMMVNGEDNGEQSFAALSDDQMIRLAEEALGLGDEEEETVAPADIPMDEDPVAAEQMADEPFSQTVSDDDFDPTDINLMVAFGMEDSNVGKKKAKTARQLGDKLEHEKVTREGRKVKLDRPEYVDASQNAVIEKGFRNKLLGLWIRLGICGVLTLLLLVFENVEFLSSLLTQNRTAFQFGGFLDPAIYPVVYAMVSLQIMLFACLCAHEQILRGFGYLFRGVPKPESMTALMTVAGILYTIVISRITVQSDEPVMFNFVVAMAALMTLVGDILATKREKMNFRIVSSEKEKHIVYRVADEQSRGEVTAFSEEEDACDVMRIEKTDFIDGFFNRMYTPDSTTNVFMSCAMGIMVAAAVLFGIFASVRGGTAVEIARVVCVTMMTVAPLSVYLSFSYPFFRATQIADAYDSAIIGESSLGEYSNASIVTFDDKNVFPSYSVKVQNIRIYNNARIDRVLYYAASVFSKAGGPLQDVFEIATLEVGHSDNVKIFDTETGFLAAEVDGVNIIFGSGAALTRKGLKIKRQEMEDDVDLSDELSIMYMFREDRLVAKMYIQYVMDGDIELILGQFQNSGLYGCVRTFDPNIDERMIAKKVKLKRIPLKVIRYSEQEEVNAHSAKMDSGLVTSGSPKSLLQIISYCDKVLHTKKTNIALAILAILIGAAIMLLVVLSGNIGVVNSLFIILYQLLWLVPMLISSKMFIR